MAHATGTGERKALYRYKYRRAPEAQAVEAIALAKAVRQPAKYQSRRR